MRSRPTVSTYCPRRSTCAASCASTRGSWASIPEEAIEQLPDDLPPPPGLQPLPGLRLREGVGVLPAVGRRWMVLAILAAIALVAAFIFGVPQLGFIGSEDEPDGGAISGTASPTAEATETARGANSCPTSLALSARRRNRCSATSQSPLS